MTKDNNDAGNEALEHPVLPKVNADIPMPSVKPAKPEVQLVADAVLVPSKQGGLSISWVNNPSTPESDSEGDEESGFARVSLPNINDQQAIAFVSKFKDFHNRGSGIFDTPNRNCTTHEKLSFMRDLEAQVYKFMQTNEFLAVQYPTPKHDPDAYLRVIIQNKLDVNLVDGPAFPCRYLEVTVGSRYLPDGRHLPENTYDRLRQFFTEAIFAGNTLCIPMTENTPYYGRTKDIASATLAILEGAKVVSGVICADAETLQDAVAWQVSHQIPNPSSLSHFLSGRNPLVIPPRPGSHESERQSVIIDAVRKHDKTDVDQAIQMLSRHVEKLDPVTASEAEQDPAIAALGALRRVKEEARKKLNRSRLKWFFSLLVLVGIGVAFYFYGSLLYTRGHYTTVATCKVPFGDAEITGNRYSTFTTKSLLGYRVGSDVPEAETTEIKLPGENLTVLGFDSTTSKWWRVNYGRGEANTPKLRNTDMYWFVGDKDKTALVKYTDFCK